MTTFRRRYSLTFWPHPLGRGCVCGQNICYHVAASFVSFNLICNMTTFRKIYSLTYWPHPLGRGGVCGQKICFHNVASFVSFNLICNMTIFCKNLILTSAPPPKSNRLGPRPSNQNPVWYVSYLLLLCLYAKFQQKILTIALVIAKLNIWPLTLRWVQRGWGKTLTLPCLSTSTWQSWSNSEKLLNIIALMKCEDHHTKKLI